ncbi:restriction endonuclease subunit S [Acinetobacter sp. NIPH 1852]|uniref:restriction endonuclease subunit S n=1 Tax=Acinetobacter sp. NIPH 1852 TaxID=2923428 RepID=UPI001F4B56FE|nr:restriction endonuclease subunit S [Acinetobacter sp. NIPH 1852]MCH7309577.1 restriction endonuclease subunit S [Acinetobacter sp. NIPH 1852]
MREEKIPQGYKKTEIGVIPEDWSCDSLESVCPKGRKYCIVDGPFGSNLKTEHYRKSGIPIITSGFVTDGTFQVDNYLFVDEEKFRQEKRSAVNPSDIVMAKIGARCGASAILPKEHVVGILSGNALKITVDESKHHTYFIWQLLWDLYTKGSLDDITTTGAQPAISMSSLKKYLIPLPPINEQTAIATALSDVDALICELEKIISKKQAIKTATMQQLLTGKTRLPQFALCEDGTKKGFKQSELGEIPKDWGVKTVYELAEKQKSQFDDGDWVEAEHITDRGIRLIQTGNIGIGQYVEKDTKKYIYPTSFEKLKCKELQKGDLLICRLAEPAGRACIFYNIGEQRVITSVDVTIFRPSSYLADRKFYVQYFSFDVWFKSVLEQVGGTTHKRISRGALGRISVPYPSIQEQTAIATILSDMDSEIQALEKRLNKTRQIKQGMMQELLTGKTRLVQPEA